jgi:hypothetical protein
MISGWSRSSKQSHETNPINTNKSEEAHYACNHSSVFLAKPSFFHPHPARFRSCTPRFDQCMLKTGHTCLYSLYAKAEPTAPAPTHGPHSFPYFLLQSSFTVHSSASVALTNTPPLQCRIRLGYLFSFLSPRSQVSPQGRLNYTKSVVPFPSHQFRPKLLHNPTPA